MLINASRNTSVSLRFNMCETLSLENGVMMLMTEFPGFMPLWLTVTSMVTGAGKRQNFSV